MAYAADFIVLLKGYTPPLLLTLFILAYILILY